MAEAKLIMVLVEKMKLIIGSPLGLFSNIAATARFELDKKRD